MRFENSEKLEALRKQAMRDQDQRGGAAGKNKLAALVLVSQSFPGSS